MSASGAAMSAMVVGMGLDHEPMTDQDGAQRWQRIEEIIRRLEPRIIELFRESEVPPREASAVLEEIVTLLLYRWDEVPSPEAWVLEMVKNTLAQLKKRE